MLPGSSGVTEVSPGVFSWNFPALSQDSSISMLLIIQLLVNWSLAHGVNNVFQEEHRKPGALIKDISVDVVRQVSMYCTSHCIAANMVSFSATRMFALHRTAIVPLADRSHCDSMVPIQVLRLESKADFFHMN